MLVARRLALEGGSETSSSAGDTDVSGGDVSGGGGDLDGEVDTVMAKVEREIELELRVKRLRELKAENAAAGGGATLAKVAPFVPAPTGAAYAAAATVDEKPKKIKRGQVPGQSVKYALRKFKKVSAYVRARTCKKYLLVCTVTLEA